MRTKDEIYRIFYLVDILKKEYLESEVKPSREKFKMLAKMIDENENTRNPEDEKDKGIGYKTLERLFNYNQDPWDISYRSLNYITRFIKGEFLSEFSNLSYINEIETDLNNFKEKNKDVLETIFEKFDKYKDPKSTKEKIFYNFKINEKKLEAADFEKIPFLEQLVRNLEERIDSLDNDGVKTALTEMELQQLKYYFNIWSEDKIERIYKNFLEIELKKSHKKLNKAINLNRYLGSFGLFWVTVDIFKEIKPEVFEKFKRFLDQEFRDEYKEELEELEGELDEYEEDNWPENNTDLLKIN